ncbi:MAG: orotidine 5'-phosphate decarboxylase [Candidatus Micrarchaeota archaeon]|nr:orotidine 5'-phosphate decarboxylase [Candidatus Micrarchaeota archaeon]
METKTIGKLNVNGSGKPSSASLEKYKLKPASLEKYKSDFIGFAFENGLKIFEDSKDDRTLKSKRISPWFLNVGEFNDGLTLGKLSEAYADAISSSGIKADLLYGIPEKGVSLVGPVATSMALRNQNIGWFFTRKMPKEHGEGTGKVDISKLVVGKVPKEGQSIIQLDDVFTAGDAKYQARQDLAKLGNFNYPLLAIALDRQEVGIDGKSAIAEYQARTGTKVISVIRATDVLNYLKNKVLSDNVDSETIAITIRQIDRLSRYLRVYGTEEARAYAVDNFGKLDHKIIDMDRSIIPACDVETIEEFEELVKQTADVKGIGGYKVGFELGLGYGLPKVVETVRKYSDKPIIYDHQKAGTDIPDTGKNFAKVCKKAGVDTVIFFPQAGPETERAWIYHALDNGLKVIVGGRMTHSAYAVSEGGFITDNGAMEMYRIAARAGISNFVVPGNKPDVIKQVKELVEAEGVSPVFYAPGFVAQGGKIEDTTKVAGEKWHAIVGRGIYKAKDMKKAAEEHASNL